MQLFYDLVPIFIFFLVYKLAGIYAATAAAIIVSVLQVVVYRIRHKHFEKMQLITMIMILLLGSATLIFHRPIFIKWKPSIIYWIFSIVFLASAWFMKKPLIQTIMESKVQLPERVWQQLNWSWILFFAVLGALNLYVVYHCTTNEWVNYKLFGTLILTFLFVLAQGLYLGKFISEKKA
jgi:intracellular septation protein